ncbi:hypothetical protein BJ508DRAFT_360891 [Ascobolus immersus RN42]|uniref:Uncharacterized protein n=1 Tax=Ascobolus immersus RN42 TaxID=1160509 RepID=A0A3N4IA60_ASCIM|nr:hypothetical protein BJ508DRAFT_360891 [Ascobolus immersus RN42]
MPQPSSAPAQDQANSQVLASCQWQCSTPTRCCIENNDYRAELEKSDEARRDMENVHIRLGEELERKLGRTKWDIEVLELKNERDRLHNSLENAVQKVKRLEEEKQVLQGQLENMAIQSYLGCPSCGLGQGIGKRAFREDSPDFEQERDVGCKRSRA